MENSQSNNQSNVFKIGTRGSALALWQARHVAAELDTATEEIIIKTSGDRFQDIPLQGQSQTGFFTKEIESRLKDGDIDLAVHSLKDLPTESDPDLDLAAYLPRADVSDLLLIHPDWHDESRLVPVKEGCTVGATSLRRQALLRLYGPWAEPQMLRGNVPTRVQKCRDQQYGAIVLARAGVERLGLDISPLVAYQLHPAIWLPAPGQGVVSVQIRRNHDELRTHVVKLDDPVARGAAILERKLLSNFEGGCHTAFGAYAWPVGGDNLWTVRFGIEDEKTGWGQTQMEARPYDELMAVTAASASQFKPLAVERQEQLCRKIEL